MGTIRGVDRNQLFLATSLEESVAPDNPVRIVESLVEMLDVEKLGFVNAMPSYLGRPSYSVKDLLKLYVYGYEQGIRSSRRLEREIGRNTELIWLLRGLRPDHKTISEFRRKNPKPLQQAFRQFVFMLDEWGLLGKEVFAVDGSKFKASNNKKQNFSRKKLQDRTRRIDEKISTYMSELEANDNAEDSESRANVQEVLASLEKRKAQYQEYMRVLEETGENEVSLVDPDARLMQNSLNGVDVSYNVQSAVDEKHSLVVEINVINNPTDHGQLSVMTKRLRKRLKIKRAITVVADRGYYSGIDLKRCQKNKVITIVSRQKTGRDAPDPAYNTGKFIYNKASDSYTCPAGVILPRTGTKASKMYANKNACEVCLHKEKCTTYTFRRITVSHYQNVFEANDKRLADNQDLYKKRQMIVEHPFGTIKRAMNGSYFLLRTLKKVRGEVALLFLAYNMKRVINILGVEGMMARLITT